MSNRTYRISEIVGTSPESVDQAIRNGIERASQTLRHISGAWVKEQKVEVTEGKVTSYQVVLEVTFVLE